MAKRPRTRETAGAGGKRRIRKPMPLIAAKGNVMKRVHQFFVAGFAALCLTLVAGAATAADIHSKPPASFKKVSTLVKLPDYLPGLGVLYVDPATLPVGPFLGYDHKGKLVNITYMVPLKDIDGHKNFETLGTVAAGVKLDHTDIQYNPGHPG